MNFQNRLKSLRENRQLSQLELSKKLNISNVTLSQYENGVRKPDINTLDELATFFNVTTDYLLGRSSNPKLSRKNELDIQKSLKEMRKNFNEGTLQMQIDGEELDDEVIEYILSNMEDALTIAKIKSKGKFTPKKYRWAYAKKRNY